MVDCHMYENEKDMNIEWSNIEKILNNTATAEEVEQFNVWLSQDATKREYFEKMHNYYIDPELSTFENNLKRKSRHSADNIINVARRRRSLFIRYIGSGVAVAAIAVISLVIYSQFEVEKEIIAEYNPIRKVEECMKIVKDNGEEIFIDKIKTSTIQVDSINKEFKYISELQEDSIEYHTLSIPEKADFTVILEDGTKAYLNAGSRLRYPNKFKKGDERKVYLSGEGYFEVAHSDEDKFVVNVDNINVVVYGTKFNINSYNKNIETVLIEGSVAINLNGKETFLKPNEKATVSKLSDDISIITVDADKYASWTTGYFMFEDEKLSIIVQVLENWYNCEIEFDNEIVMNELFSCNVVKTSTIDDFLNAISNTNKIKFKKNNGKYLIW